MYEIIRLFFDICLFRKGPEDVPHSLMLLQLSIVAYAVIGFLILYISSGFISAIQQLFVEVILVLFLSWSILSVVRRTERYYQTVTALFGTDAMISLFALPVMSTLVTPQSSPIAVPVVVILMLWHLGVTAHIFRQALSVTFSLGLGLAVLYILLSYWVMAMLFPEVLNVA